MLVHYEFELKNCQGDCQSLTMTALISLLVSIVGVSAVCGISVACENPWKRFRRLIKRPVERCSRYFGRVYRYFRRKRHGEEGWNLRTESDSTNDSISWGCVSPSPTCTIIEYESTGCGKINGVTVMNNIIYIVRYARNEVEKYAADTHEQLDSIPIPQLKEPRDLVSCVKAQAIYISDCGTFIVHKLLIENLHTVKWRMNSAPEGLSVLENTHVLIVFPREQLVRKFSSEGEQLEEIRIPNSLHNPHHAIMYKTHDMLICYGENTDAENGVYSFNTQNKYLHGNNSRMWPTRMNATKDGHILLLSFKEEQVLLLNGDLNFDKVLLPADTSIYQERFEQPDRMFLDEANKVLYVTENTDRARIFIYKFNGSPDAIYPNTNDNQQTNIDNSIGDNHQHIKGIQWKNVSPSFIRLVSEHEKRGCGKINGITILKGIIYIVRYAKNEIERYDAANEEPLDPIQIPHLVQPRDLASCTQSLAIYISDCGNNFVHKLLVENLHSETWNMKSAPEGLSVLKNGDLLVMFPSEKMIRKFKSDGRKLASFRIAGDISNPHHALLNMNSEIIICYGKTGDQEHGVCLANGSRRFDGTGNGNEQMWPARITETKDGHILALSFRYQTIVLLKSDLTHVRTLLEGGSNKKAAFEQPDRMFLDEDNRLLYVTENTDTARTFVFKLD